jgi:hypothetical protein
MLVGTYRMQTGFRAKGNLGYYSAQLFDMKPFERIRGKILELGRACVHEEYRNTTALFLLWKGIASYAALMQCPLPDRLQFPDLARRKRGHGALSRSWATHISSNLRCAPNLIPPHAAG